mmetsp:Transcript_6868/g.14993  ORF Transcript_6868/g.14993 Transcript_6868/m.14993 type:complete len:1215 (+) Transcript_6868:309-3953(+)
MIGPVPMDDPFNDPFPAGGDRTAMMQWQERQRRQRSVRLLMMLLMFLLLMDGEEPNNRRNRRHHRYAGDGDGNLRRGRKKRRGRPAAVLEPVVLAARMIQDDKIHRSSMLDPRYRSIVDLNGGRDVEGELLDWARKDAKEMKRKEVMEKASATAAEAKVDPKRTTRHGISDKMKRKEDPPENDDDDEEEANRRKVHHYPGNVTGYYRGEWRRIAIDDAADEERNVNDEDGNSKSGSQDASKAVDDETIITNETEIEARMKESMHSRKSRVGVFLLPNGTLLPLEPERTDNSTVSTLSGAFSSTTSSTPALADSDSRGRGNGDDPVLSLTQASGRAACQLYARSIPAMSQISLVEGYVKLYDGMATAFSTRRDLLMRVRGIIIHPTGRLSLVANAAEGRSAMIIRTDEDDNDVGGGGGSSGDDGGFKKNERKDGEQHSLDSHGKHRRLEEAVDELVNSPPDSSVHTSDQENDAIMRIRDDAISLFAESELLGAAKPIFISDGEGVEISDLGLLSMNSVSEVGVMDNSLDNFFNGERTRQRFEAAARWFSRSQVARRKMTDGCKASFASLVSTAHRWLPVEPVEFPASGVVDVVAGGKRRRLSDIRVNNSYTSQEERTRSLKSSARFAKNASLTEVNSDPPTNASRITKMKRSDYAVFLKRMTRDIQIFPFVPDDEEKSIERAVTPIDRKIPYREKLLEHNGAHCEFELNFDIEQTQWSVRQWKKLVQWQVKELEDLDPTISKEKATDGEDVAEKSSALRKSSTSTKSSMSTKDEALVMMLSGSVVSTGCGFSSFVNVTAIRTDWEHTTGKAINYSFYMMLTCLTQIVVLLRQLLHTQAQSAATRVSLISIGWQTVLDAILCISHIFLCLVMQPLFTAFASVAFFKLLIFCVIEMKYMAIILQARHGTTTTEETQRRIAMLHLRFYSALMFAVFLFFYAGERHRTVYIIALYSFWVPQIIHNVISQARRPMHHYYIYGMSISRLVAPLYLFGLPNNFLKEINPDHSVNVLMCELLVLWVGVQTAILIGQEKYGARFMIPAIFLPPKYNYYRPIPPTLLPESSDDDENNTTCEVETETPNSQSSSPSASQGLDPTKSTDIAVEPPLLVAMATDGATTEPCNRNNKAARAEGVRSRLRTGLQAVEKTTIQEEPMDGGGSSDGPAVTLDCVICYNDIDATKRTGYMIAPCNHIFHRDCLMQWMEVKMECPICRKELPAP